MEKYDYHGKVREDVEKAMRKWFDEKEIKPKYIGDFNELRDEIYDHVYDTMCDSNYNISDEEIEEMLCHNMGLALKAAEWEGVDIMHMKWNPGYIDICIRLMIMHSIIDEVIDDLWKMKILFLADKSFTNHGRSDS